MAGCVAGLAGLLGVAAVSIGTTGDGISRVYDDDDNSNNNNKFMYSHISIDVQVSLQ